MLAEKRFVTHKLIIPGAIEDRLYQRRILEQARRKNTLVILPTALGKTMIALLLAIERIDFGKVLFLAPTRPLVQQHCKTFMDKTLLEKGELATAMGSMAPEKRVQIYSRSRVIFATPQCILNDIERGLLNLENFSLIIFDEAHRARGNYAYVKIADYYIKQAKQPLILGLTASPGGRREKIEEICRNLHIEAIECRTDEDEDVKPYVHPISISWVSIKLPESYKRLSKKLREMLAEEIKGIKSMGFLSNVPPEKITRRELIALNEELQRRLNSGGGEKLYDLKIHATAALSLAHMIELIETQGPETLSAFIEKTLIPMASEGSRGHKAILYNPAFRDIEGLLYACLWDGNPKINELIRLLKSQMDENQNSKVIVFTQYRDTVKTIMKALENISNLKVERFVGQADRENEPGMSQSQQRVVIDKLRSGEINVLVATSIAEEGLDIPDVDHVIFYEPVPSEIRYIQRRGRTGRRVAGKVTILMAEGTLDEAFYWSSLLKARKMKQIVKQLKGSTTKVESGEYRRLFEFMP
ncbi:DEAD/DEAH box helicase family protein [Candidatus Bathyarchaeota archaeon]|nr:DEAD/DEAH box helicase family protein [Candidatus Bathyarchaeota archaeon]